MTKTEKTYVAGIYSTRERAEEAAKRWEDVFDADQIKIRFDGFSFLLMLPVGEDYHDYH